MAPQPSDVVAPRKRPLGLTLLCLGMAWLGCASFLNAIVFPSAAPDLFPAYFAALALAYGLAAWATVIGLWRMKGWALTAFRAWGGACLALMVFLVFLFRGDLALANDPVIQLALHLAFLAMFAVIFWLAHRYIRRHIG